FASLLQGFVFLAIAFAAQAQPFPSRPVRFIVPYTPGGLGDSFARAVGQDLAERVVQPVVIDNRPGASQAIGAEATAKAPPDGHTIFMGTQSGLVLNTIARKKLPYDPVRDLAPVSLLFTSPLYLVVHPSVQANSVKELIALANKRPGKLTFASIGNGTSQHLAGELFRTRAKVDIVHVPYKGSSPATTDLLGGQVDMMFEGGVSSLPHVKAGKLRALATTGRKRTEAMPELPTMVEAGVPDFDITVWFGLVAPAKTPGPIIERLNKEVVEILRTPALKEKFTAAGIDITPSTPAELGERIRADLPYYTKLMREAGIQPE
ncbi:MAG TPA: tripartite tricarboxylate transporter substrate binding protein, partial [Burkholderiales bacterium]|nr:tripartite tricarboxylate transporter substrate binding protein [Burkholderiales bacterium]